MRSHIAARTPIKAIKFCSTLLIAPPKAAVLGALGLPLPRNAQLDERTLKLQLARRAECQIIDLLSGDAYEIVVASTPSRCCCRTRAAKTLGRGCSWQS